MDTHRNLLFGVVALQAELIDRNQFAEACTAWTHRKESPLADILQERGWLTPESRADVENLLQHDLEKHGGDARASLAEAAKGDVLHSLSTIDDRDVRQSLAGLPRVNGAGSTADTPFSPPSKGADRAGVDKGGRYRLTRLHATGGLGRVWLARDTDLGRDVALKELRPEMALDDRVWGRFMSEARITGQLEHPSIVPVYELARRPGDQQPFYTMRFVKGRTLTEAIRGYHEKLAAGKAQPLDLRSLLGAFVAVCNAVAYAHARGVLHRDLKGQNIVLGDFGEVIVLDWGLARLLGSHGQAVSRGSHHAAAGERAEGKGAGDPNLVPVALEPRDGRDKTAVGQAIGTPAYMAPEQARGRLDLLDARTDVYGLGAILYEMLTGQPPFIGIDTNEILRRVKEEEPVPPRQLCPVAPPALEAICLRAIAKAPAERYASAQDLAREVQHWLADEPVEAYPDPLPARLGRWARRHKAVVTGAAALLGTAVVALGVTTFLINQEKRQTEQERERAERNASNARERQQQAQTSARDADTQKRAAEASALMARRHLYVAHMNFARRSWDANEIANMRQLLDRHVPVGRQTDLRGFEWYYFWRLAHSEVRTLLGHGEAIDCLAIAPDGKTVATATYQKGLPGSLNELKLWDAATGQLLATLKGQRGAVRCLTFSPDGKTLITAGGWMQEETRRFPDGTVLKKVPAGRGEVIFWDVAARRPRTILHDAETMFTSLALSPDGKTLATGSMRFPDPARIKLWDVPSARLIGTLGAGRKDMEVGCLTFTPDGQTLIAAGRKNAGVKFIDVATGDERHTLPIPEGKQESITALAIDPDGRTLALTAGDKSVQLWDLATKRLRATLEGHTDAVRALAFSPDGANLASASDDTTIKLWDVASRELRATLKGHTERVTALAFTRDGKTLASGGWDKAIRLWDVSRDTAARTLPVDADHSTMTWELMTQRPLSASAARVALAVAPDGKTLAVGSRGNHLQLHDLATGKVRTTLRGHANWINAAAFAPNGKTLATASWDKTVRLWDAASGRELAVLEEHSNGVLAVAFTPDSRTLASAGADKTVKLWDVATKKVRLTLEGAGDSILALAVSSNGELLAAASADKTIRLWNVATGQHLGTLTGHMDRVTCVAFSPGGQMLASGSADRTVKLWTSATSQEPITLRGHTEAILSLAFSPDGRSLVSAGTDQTLKFWDAAAGEERATLKGGNFEITTVAFTPDGRTMASVGADLPVDRNTAGLVRNLVSIALGPADAVKVRYGPSAGDVKLWEAVTDLKLAAHAHQLGEQHESLGQADEAEKAYRRAVTLFQPRAGRDPVDPAAGRELARSLHNLARIMLARQRYEGAEDAGKQALRLREDLARRFPQDATLLSELADTLDNLGVMLREPVHADAANPKRAGEDSVMAPGLLAVPVPAPGLQGPPGLVWHGDATASREFLERAVRYQQQAATLDPEETRYKELLRQHLTNLAETLVQQRQHAKAAETVKDLVQIDSGRGSQYYSAGELLARCVRLAAQDTKLPAQQRQQLADHYAERAVAYLRQATEKGFRDIDSMTQASAFASLKERDDFKKAAAELEARRAGERARQLREQGHASLRARHVAQAENALRQARDLLEKLAGDFPDAASYRRELAFAELDLGHALFLNSRTAEAEECWTQALGRLQELQKQFPDQPVHREGLADLRARMADIMAGLRRWKEAEAAYQDAMVYLEQLVTEFPKEAAYRQRLAAIQNQLGIVLLGIRQLPRADEILERALTLRRRLVEEFPDQLVHQSELGGVLHNLAEVRLARREWQAALELLREALRRQKTALQSDPRHPTYQRFLRNHYWALAETWVRLENHAEAAAVADELAGVSPYELNEYSRAAMILARSAQLAAKDMKLSESERRTTSEGYAGRTVDLLRKLVQRGFEDGKALKASPDFTPLHAHDGFKQLVRELEVQEARRKWEQALGNLQNSMQFQEGGKRFLAENVEFGYRRAVTLLKELVGDDPKNGQYQMTLWTAQEHLATHYRAAGQKEKGDAVAVEARATLEKLAREHPDHLEAALAFGSGPAGPLNPLADPAQAEALLNRLSELIRTLESAPSEQPDSPRRRQALSQAYASRADLRIRRGAHAEALKDYDQAIALAEEPRRNQLRASRAIVLAHLGNHARAVAEAGALVEQAGTSTIALYNLACTYSVASAAVLKDRKLTKDEQEKLSAQHARRALELLTQARSRGLFDNRGAREHLSQDPDLDPLRSREDFQQLLRATEKRPGGK